MFTLSPYEDGKLNEYGWNDNNSEEKTHEVGMKSPNVLGIYDMSGNVWEWCHDSYNADVYTDDDTYKVGDILKNPLGAINNANRIVRGGCYLGYSNSCAVSHRSFYPYYDDHEYIGMRLVRSLF